MVFLLVPIKGAWKNKKKSPNPMRSHALTRAPRPRVYLILSLSLPFPPPPPFHSPALSPPLSPAASLSARDDRGCRVCTREIFSAGKSQEEFLSARVFWSLGSKGSFPCQPPRVFPRLARTRGSKFTKPRRSGRRGAKIRVGKGRRTMEGRSNEGVLMYPRNGSSQ